MALSTTPTIAICLIAGIAAGVGLARPGDTPAPPVAAPAAAPAPAPAVDAAPPEVVQDDQYGGLAEAADTVAESAPVEAAAPAAISIEGFAFAGQTTVSPGSTIEVTNLDGAPHTLTADNDAFNTGNLSQNQVATLTAPTAPGTYAFFCAIHPSMTGALTVG